MSAGLKFESGLPPARIHTAEGFVERPCHFRRAGLVIVEVNEADVERYSITHEGTGQKLCPNVAEPVHALALAAALLHLPIDWTASGPAVGEQARGLTGYHLSLLSAIRHGRIQLVDMSKAVAS